MDKFDKHIKNALSNYEATYDDSHWADLNKKLGAPKSTLYKWIGGVAAVLVIAVVGNYLFNNNSLQDDNKTIVHQNNDNVDAVKKNNVKNINNTPKENTTVEIEHSNSSNSNHHNSINDQQLEDDNSNVNTTNHQNNSSIDTEKGNVNDVNESASKTSNIGSGKPKILTSEIIVDDNSKCLNESVEFSPSVPNQNVIYTWDLGDGTTVVGNYVNHKYQKAGNYNVVLTLKDVHTNEVIEQSQPVEVVISEIPQASFSYEFSNGVMPLVAFKSNTENNNVQWEILGETTANTPSFEYVFKHKGEYVVKLTTTNENGCSSTSTQVITIDNDYNLLSPNAFSPNGDNLNDYFIPKALPLLNLPFTMLIYDRQGNLLYQTTDANKPWDGNKFNDGTPAPDGVYVWVVQLTNEKGELENYQDQITITR